MIIHRRLIIIILLSNEKIIKKCGSILDNRVNKGSFKNGLLFDILLDYCETFGLDAHFRDNQIYVNFFV